MKEDETRKDLEMPKRTATKGGIYLYAVVAGSEDRKFGPLGLHGSEVYTVTDGDVEAVVSDLPSADKLRPERRHLAAHQGVLSRLLEDDNVVLPVSFGTVADSGEAVRNMLSRYHKELMQQIERVHGKIEIEVRVTLDVPNVFEYFINTHPELKETRDRIYDSQREPSRDEKIELGQLFERILNEDREAFTKQVLKVLSAHSSEIKANKCRNEQEIMRLSCLVDKEAQEEFQSAIAEAAELFDDNFSFEHSGPFPPYNFVDVRIKM